MQQHGSKYFARLTSVWPGNISDSRNSSLITQILFDYISGFQNLKCWTLKLAPDVCNTAQILCGLISHQPLDRMIRILFYMINIDVSFGKIVINIKSSVQSRGGHGATEPL